MIDRAYTKAEARYIPNGPDSTADMAHPTRTGDLVVFAYPPYQFDAATPGTLVARSAFFGQHGYVPDVQNLDANVNMRATFIAGGGAIRPNVVAQRPAHDRPGADHRLPDGHPRAAAIAGRGAARPAARRRGAHAGARHRPDRLPRPARADHDDAWMAAMCPSAARRSWRRCSTRKRRSSPAPSFLFASGDNVGASPANSGLLQDMPAIDVENAWGLDATSYGNHEFDYGVARLLQHQARANFPFLGANIVDDDDAAEPGLGAGHARLRLWQPADRRHRHRAEGDARAGQRGRHGRPEVPATRSRPSRPSPRSCASRASRCRSC